MRFNRLNTTLLAGVTACLLATTLASAAPAAAGSAPPNFVFILIDDMGYGDLGCYGNTEVQTPNIDRLAAEGVRFTKFYVASPICSPSRVAFTTGQFPARWDITSFIASRQENEARGMAQWLPTEAPSVARALKSAGYRTAHIGKWHMGGGRDVGEAPLISEYGFDVTLTQFEGLGDRLLPTFDTLFPNQDKRAMPLGIASAKLGRGESEFVKRHEVTPRFVKRSIEFIRKSREANQPFYLNLWPDDTHSPWEPSPENRGDGSPLAMYYGVIKELDQALAPLLDHIRSDEQLRQNTVIVLATDNGPEGPRTTSGLRGYKGQLYEGGIRVPFIVWWPAGQKAATENKINDETVVAGVDLYPTVLKLAGAEIPSEVKLDGEDMSAAFAGEEPERQGTLFWVRPPDRKGKQGGRSELPDLAVRQHAWKLLIEQDGSNAQLYDVLKDPGEQTNLAEKHPDVVADLKTRLFECRKTLPQ